MAKKAKYHFKNLVFEGGGVRGIAYVGVLQELEKRNITQNIIRAGGTSAGAINALLFCLGYTSAEQKVIMEKLDFNRFKDDSPYVFTDIKRLLEGYGWHRGDFFRQWVAGLIDSKLGSPDATFNDLYRSGRPNLFVYGTNLSTGFSTVFSIVHTPTSRLADAVRISMSIPFFFKAIRDPRGDVMVDGGVQVNYPIKLFDREDYIENPKAVRKTSYYEKENTKLVTISPESKKYIYNMETLGVRLDRKEEIAHFRYGREPPRQKIDSIYDFTLALISSLMNAQENYHLHEDDWHRTIYVDTLDVGTLEFDLSEKKKEELIRSGRLCTKKYFEWFDNPKALDTVSDNSLKRPINRM